MPILRDLDRFLSCPLCPGSIPGDDECGVYSHEGIYLCDTCDVPFQFLSLGPNRDSGWTLEQVKSTSQF